MNLKKTVEMSLNLSRQWNFYVSESKVESLLEQYIEIHGLHDDVYSGFYQEFSRALGNGEILKF